MHDDLQKWFIWGIINIAYWVIIGFMRDCCTKVKDSVLAIEILWYIGYAGILGWYIAGLYWRFADSARAGCGDIIPDGLLAI